MSEKRKRCGNRPGIQKDNWMGSKATHRTGSCNFPPWIWLWPTEGRHLSCITLTEQRDTVQHEQKGRLPRQCSGRKLLRCRENTFRSNTIKL